MICVEQLKNTIAERVESYLQADNPLRERATQQLGLLDALGSVLAQEVVATMDLPRQNLSAMDGFALAAGSELGENQRIEIIGESCAGTPFVGEIQPNQGVRIFTGAVVPDGCDTVVMQEHTDFSTAVDKQKSYHITLQKAAKAAANIRYQGEEITHGEPLLHIGKRLNPSDISLLASMGVDQVKVFSPLTVGLLATGDELVALGQPLTSLAQIYNSNTPTLQALLDNLPIRQISYPIVKDDLQLTKQAVMQAISECDVIISTAGVSVGDYDFLTQVTRELGQIHQYKVAMKPGKPFVFGEFSDNLHKNRAVLYFGLPGNPLSTVVGCINFVRPALWRLSGVSANEVPMQLRLRAVTTHAIKKAAGRQEYQRAHFEQIDGEHRVTPASAQDSHRIKQLSAANCLIILPEDCTGVAAGETVQIMPFDWIIG